MIEKDLATHENLMKSIRMHFPDCKADSWPQWRRNWLMGKVICDLRGQMSPKYILAMIDDFIDKVKENPELLEGEV